MGDNEVEYARMLKKMENEILALKTAHQRPLGALNFFKDTLNFNINLSYSFGIYVANINVVVTIAEPSVVPPIVQTGWDIPPGFYSVNFQDLNISGDYSTWTYQLQFISSTTSSATVKIGTLSSQPIESITWSYV